MKCAIRCVRQKASAKWILWTPPPLTMGSSIFRSEDKNLNSSQLHCVEDDELEEDRLRDQLGSCRAWFETRDVCVFGGTTALRSCGVSLCFARCSRGATSCRIVPFDNFAFRNVVVAHPGSSPLVTPIPSRMELIFFSPTQKMFSAQRHCLKSSLLPTGLKRVDTTIQQSAGNFGCPVHVPDAALIASRTPGSVRPLP